MRALQSLALGVLLLSAIPANTQAQDAIDWSRRPVLLMTMGQGDEVFEKFGHNAIVVWDDAAGQPLVYNWGMFDFEQPNFIGRFLTGDTRYWMEPHSVGSTLQQYAQLNRTVVVQELALTPSQKAQLVRQLAVNAREENKWYRYDYYRDNCSTRARDAIDSVTGGALRRAMQSADGVGSYRWHTRRLLAYSLPLYFGSQLVLGVHADAPLTEWQQAFLPRSLSRSLTRITLPAAEGLPARTLASAPDTLVFPRRAVEPESVMVRIAPAALAGVVLGLLLLGLTVLGRLGAAVAIGTWSLVSVLMGTVLLLAWFATQHGFMARNPSVALLNPAWLAGLVAAVMAARGGVTRAIRITLLTLLVIAVAGTVGALLTGHGGSALELAALVLPAHAATVFGADRFKRHEGVRPAVAR